MYRYIQHGTLLAIIIAALSLGSCAGQLEYRPDLPCWFPEEGECAPHIVQEPMEARARKVEGSVRDIDGLEIPEAQVLLKALNEEIRETRTDRHGKFSFPKLPMGRYVLTICMRGWEPQTIYITVSGAARRSDLGEIFLHLGT